MFGSHITPITLTYGTISTYNHATMLQNQEALELKRLTDLY